MRITRRIRPLLVAALCIPFPALGQEPVTTVPLWPAGAPGSEGKTALEKIEDSRVSSVHKPSLSIHLPLREKATGAGVIVIPGGGHRYLAIDHEGYAVARWLSEHGIAGFVLKYRLAREEGSTYTIEEHSLRDTQRALRLVKSHAVEWGLDPARVGVIGFSAGGELAALVSLRNDAGVAGDDDKVERQSSRPARS